jgi:hypothetical protein
MAPIALKGNIMADVSKLEEIKSRIAKLQALANDKGATEGEALQAASMVQKLLDKYNLALEEITPIKQRSSNEAVKQNVNRANSRMFSWECTIINAVTFSTGTDAVYFTDRVAFIGLPADVTIASQLYTQYVAIAQQLATKATKAYGANYLDPRTLTGPYSLRSYRLSYLDGFADGLYRALKVARREADPKITALVVIKDALVAEAKDRFYPKLKAAPNFTPSGNAQAEARGFNDGYSVGSSKSKQIEG